MQTLPLARVNEAISGAALERSRVSLRSPGLLGHRFIPVTASAAKQFIPSLCRALCRDMNCSSREAGRTSAI